MLTPQITAITQNQSVLVKYVKKSHLKTLKTWGKPHHFVSKVL